MAYAFLADMVVLVHAVWIIFLITGAYWGRTHLLVRNLHVAGLGFAIISQIFGWYCPLTHLEVWLKEHQRPSSAYPGSFIAFYAEKLIYIRLSAAVILIMTIGLVGINIFMYWKTFGHRDQGNSR